MEDTESSRRVVPLEYASPVYQRPGFFRTKMVATIAILILCCFLSFAYTIHMLDGQRQLARLGPGCGTCMAAILKEIHATPERDLSMAVFAAGAALVCGIHAIRLRIAAQLAARWR